MHHSKRFVWLALVVAGACLLASVSVTQATLIWSGYGVSFSKTGADDPMLPENQDRITDNVWITRGNAQGIFNIAQEAAYQGGGTSGPSPVDTEWAFGTTADWDTLTYDTWAVTVNMQQPALPGQDMVVHLITDDIYLDLRFTEWQTAFDGANVAYVRAPEPSSLSLLALGGVALLRRRR